MQLPVNYDQTHFSIRKQVREEYVRIQEGKCHHCKSPLQGEPAKHISEQGVDPHLFPKGFFNWPIHLHHNHKTGMTIGAVHTHCNAVLWQYLGE